MNEKSEFNHYALLVVDVQVGVMRNAWNGQAVIANIAMLVEKARAALVPVIWVQHNDDELVLGSPDWATCTRVDPQPF